MKRAIPIFMVMLTSVAVFHCNKPVSRPESQYIRFRFQFHNCETPPVGGIFKPKGDIPAVPLGKAVQTQSIDLAMVLVVDFSAYDSWGDVVQTDWFNDYARARDTEWTGDRNSWSEWVRFIGNYMRIAANQALEIKDREAVGTVAGAKGLNRIIVGLLENNVIRYFGEGMAVGMEGETQDVEIDVYAWNGTTGGQATVAAVEIKPDSTLLFGNQVQQFTCQVRYSDWTTSDVTSQATWSTNPGMYGTINSAGRFQAGSASDGNEKVRVSYQGKQDSVKVKVIKGAPGDMVLIPAGSFTMGKTATSGTSDNSPAHTVILDAFFIDRFEVTCAQYAVFLNAAMATGAVQTSEGKPVKNGHVLFDATSGTQLKYANGQFTVEGGMENHPIARVSWWGAEAYAVYYGKRLPTEAEWEKAARGTDAREYPWGNAAATGAYYNFSYYSKPVGQFHPQGDSPYGLSDMAGNAYEWVNDWYSDKYYASSPSTNPKGPAAGTEKVLRGGSFFYIESYFVTCYARGRLMPEETRSDHGFRCAKNP
jgi:formylglycine-generating enzyme required for sulfatase activity